MSILTSRDAEATGNPGQALAVLDDHPATLSGTPPNLVHARNASRRYGHAGKHYPGQWRHVEEAARLPDAHARRSTGSARTTSALAMTQRSRRTAELARQRSGRRQHLVNRTDPLATSLLAASQWVAGIASGGPVGTGCLERLRLPDGRARAYARRPGWSGQVSPSPGGNSGPKAC